MIHAYRFFNISVNFAFNLSHYVTSYIHHTGENESKKGVFLKKKNNKVTKNLLQEDSNTDPQNQLELNVDASTLWNTSVNADIRV